jgi:hypothetical protein
MNALRERIKNLIISGLKPSEIVSIVGCSPSYISQLLADTEFKEAVQAGVIASAEKNTEAEHLDKRYETVEHRLLSAIEDKIPEASMGEVVRAVEAINKRKDDSYKRKNPVTPGPAIQLNVVSLALPAQALKTLVQPVVQLNSQNEIVAIEGRHLAPMSAEGVKNLFAEIKREEQKVVAEL